MAAYWKTVKLSWRTELSANGCILESASSLGRPSGELNAMVKWRNIFSALEEAFSGNVTQYFLSEMCSSGMPKQWEECLLEANL